MKQVIGKANVYFTLWEVGDPYKEYTSATSFYWKVNHNYMRNLSMNLEAAKAKVHGDYEIDLELRGTSSYSVRMGGQQNEATASQFAYGKYEGSDIATCDDIWQLERLLEYQYSPNFLLKRRAAYARRRLIDLGIYVKYHHIVEIWFNENGDDGKYIKMNRSYTTPKDAAILEAKKKKTDTFDHYFNEGDKPKLALKEVERFWYNTTFGYREVSNAVVTYIDDQGRGFKYNGATPPTFISADEFTNVIGTVSHGEYKGVKETRLKRMSLAK